MNGSHWRQSLGVGRYTAGGEHSRNTASQLNSLYFLSSNACRVGEAQFPAVYWYGYSVGSLFPKKISCLRISRQACSRLIGGTCVWQGGGWLLHASIERVKIVVRIRRKFIFKLSPLSDNVIIW
jgi:hypothetical protein